MGVHPNAATLGKPDLQLHVRLFHDGAFLRPSGKCSDRADVPHPA